MNQEAVARLETSAGRSFPPPYKDALLDFPVLAYAGNSETELWDDEEALCRMNDALRSGAWGVAAWPAHMWAIGHSIGDPSVFAIDLRQRQPEVWWVDHGDLQDAGSGPVSSSFARWLEGYRQQTADHLAEIGAEPSSSVEERVRLARREGNRDLGCLAIAALAVLLLIVVLFVLVAEL